MSTVTINTMKETAINIPETSREQTIALLNQHLADLSDLRLQTKHAHWNIRGPKFYALHKLFDELAATYPDLIDEIAERISQLGGYAKGTARMTGETSRLPEYPLDISDDIGHVKALVERHGQLANDTRVAIDKSAEWGDETTADLLTELSRTLDKNLWFLEAHINT